MANKANKIEVKRGDTHEIELTVNASLIGATGRRLLAKSRNASVDTEPIVLEHTVVDADAGKIAHVLTGTLAVGQYNLELEIARDNQIRTAPSKGYMILIVGQDLG